MTFDKGLRTFRRLNERNIMVFSREERNRALSPGRVRHDHAVVAVDHRRKVHLSVTGLDPA